MAGRIATTSFKNRDEAILHFSTIPPQLESDYYISIQSDMPNTLRLPIIGFSFPQVGLSYSNNDEYGHPDVTPLHTNSIELTYVLRVGESVDPIQVAFSDPTIYLGEEIANGVPQFRKHSSLPDLTIYKKGPVNDQVVLDMYHCRVSSPRPSINLASNNVSSYTVTVYFEDFYLR